MIDTILFDLDGTLLPLDPQKFTDVYFPALAEKIVPLGYDGETLIKAVWKGTASMQANSGTTLNHHYFWQTFCDILGGDAASLEPVCDDFYQNEFNIVKTILPKNINHKKLISSLKDRGYTLVLASNPVFPLVAVQTRLSWIGLSTADFDYISHYQNSRFCKPNLGYYTEILANIKKKPEQCLMVGNNLIEDGCISKLGAQVYLVIDMLEGGNMSDIDAFPHGPIEDLEDYLNLIC